METCAYCGTTDESVATHSNTLECQQCWNYRKLDRPAALHWAKVAEGFLSNVDVYDWTRYLPSCGLSKDQMATMLSGAQRVEMTSRFLVENGPRHTWTDEVQAHFENEERRK